MLVKFKRKRRIFINVFGALVVAFFIFSLVSDIINNANMLTSLSLFFQVLVWAGFYFYQAAKYDDEKVSAQFGWPRIYYDEIISVKTKWGDIIIKSEKREIQINREVVDEDSLNEFINHLEEKTPKRLDKSKL